MSKKCSMGLLLFLIQQNMVTRLLNVVTWRLAKVNNSLFSSLYTRLLNPFPLTVSLFSFPNLAILQLSAIYIKHQNPHVIKQKQQTFWVKLNKSHSKTDPSILDENNLPEPEPHHTSDETLELGSPCIVYKPHFNQQYKTFIKKNVI